MKCFLAIAAFILPVILSSQDGIRKVQSTKGIDKIYIDFEYGDLKIEYSDQDEIILDGEVLINGEVNEKPFSFDIIKEGNKLTLKSKADLSDIKKTVTIVKEDGSKIYIRDKEMNITNSDDDDIKYVNYGTEVDAKFTIKIPKNKELQVQSKYGNIILKDYFEGMNINNTYGAIEATFKNITSEPSFYLHSKYDHVDVTISEKSKSSIELKTDYGKIYSDMNIKPNLDLKNQDRPKFGDRIVSQLNPGNGKIKLVSNYDNIYLRKS